MYICTVYVYRLNIYIYIYIDTPMYLLYSMVSFSVVHHKLIQKLITNKLTQFPLELRVTVRSTNSENWFFRKVIKCLRTSLAGKLVSCWPEAQTPGRNPRGIPRRKSNQKKIHVGFFLKKKRTEKKGKGAEIDGKKKLITGVVFFVGFLNGGMGPCSSLFSFNMFCLGENI